MQLTTTQNPMNIDEPATIKQSDFLLMAIDRGNSGSKIAVSVNGCPLSPFKIPSVIRKVGEGEGLIKIGNQAYLCGETAISMTTGATSTPLGEGDKVKGLAVVIASAIHKTMEVYPLTDAVDLSLIVSSPFATDSLSREIRAELKPLEQGFEIGGKSIKIAVQSVAVEFEGTVLLKSDPMFNGVIDIGFGTILAGFRKASGEVAIVPLMGGDLGGCNLVIKGLLNDPRFLAAVKKSGASAPPSAERLSAKLSEGVTTLRGIDLRPMLKDHMKVLKTRIEDAAQAIATELRLDSLASDGVVTPKVALIGGGAALLKTVLGDSLTNWLCKYNLEFYDEPDYQTATVMHQIAKLGGSN